MKNRYSRGFTLIELMVTIAVLAILLAVGVPSFRSFIVNNRVSSLTNELVSSLNLARSEAIKRGLNVTVCKSADPAANSPTCDDAASWQKGWVVFVDANMNGSRSNDETVIAVGQPTVSDVVITPDSTLFISFIASGASNASASLVICLQGVARTVAVSAIGRTSVTAGTCS